MDHLDTLDRALAYHEAGHQVIAYALGVSVDGVEISNGSGRAYDGLRFRHYVPESMSESDWRHFRAKALILLAGEAAEKAFYEEAGLSAPSDLWSGPDREALSAHLAQVFRDARPSGEYATEKMLDDLDKMVERLWKQVARVADALIAGKRVSGSDVEALLRAPGIVWDEEL